MTTKIRRTTIALTIGLAVSAAVSAAAFGQDEATGASFDRAAGSIQQKLSASLAELQRLSEQMALEKIPLSRELREVESDLAEARLEYQQVSRLRDGRILDLGNLREEIKSREEEATYLSNLLEQYIRNFESRLHIAEMQRYEATLDAAKLAAENTALADEEVFEEQVQVVEASLDRLHEALGGARFEGTAVDPEGLVKPGTFVLVGPSALFRSADGVDIGTAEQRLGSLEANVQGFELQSDARAASDLVVNTHGFLVLDPSLGNAHKIAATNETFVEHVQKGGPVMVPIFALAGAALVVALYKWLTLAFIRRPARRDLDGLLDAVARQDGADALRRANAIPGPVGRMLAVGAEHLDEPKELVEEVMYETVLTTRLRLNRMLSFIAVSAAAAPLLGLLGTVTGIINTFKMIMVFGSGDVKTLSGGISEALITTEFGLIVAIPSLLLHAFLSRKARGVSSLMETIAVSFINQVSRTQQHAATAEPPRAEPPAPHQTPDGRRSGTDDRARTSDEVRDALMELLAPAMMTAGDGRSVAPRAEPFPQGSS